MKSNPIKKTCVEEFFVEHASEEEMNQASEFSDQINIADSLTDKLKNLKNKHTNDIGFAVQETFQIQDAMGELLKEKSAIERSIAEVKNSYNEELNKLETLKKKKLSIFSEAVDGEERKKSISGNINGSSAELIKNEFEEINQKLTALIQEIEQAEELKNNLSRDVENLTVKKNEHQRFISEAHQELEQIRSSLEDGSRMTENFINKANHLREEIEVLEKQKEKKTSEVLILGQNLPSESRNENFNEINQKNIELKNNLQQEINQLKKQHEHLVLINQQHNHEKMIHESKIGELGHTYKMKQAEVFGLEDRLKVLQKEIEKFNNMKSDVIKSLEVVKKEKWLIQTAADELKCNIEASKQIKVEIERHIEELSKKTQDLQSEISGKKDQVGELENRYNHFSDEFEKLHKNYLELQKNTYDICNSKSEAANKLSEINEELFDKKNQLNHVSDKYQVKEAELKKKITLKRIELSTIKSDLGKLKKNYQSKTIDLDQVMKNISNAESTLDNLSLKQKSETDQLEKISHANELQDSERLRLLVKKSKIDAQIDQANKTLQKIKMEETESLQKLSKLNEQNREVEQAVAIFEKEFDIKAQKVQELNSRIKYQSDILKRQFQSHQNIWQDVQDLYQSEKIQYDKLLDEKNKFLKDYEKNIYCLENRVAVLKVKETVTHQNIDNIHASIQNEIKCYDEQVKLNHRLEIESVRIQRKVDSAEDVLKVKIAEANVIIGQYQKEHQALHEKSEELDLKRLKMIVFISQLENQTRNKTNNLEKLQASCQQLLEQINDLASKKEALSIRNDILDVERLKLIVATSKTQNSYDILKAKTKDQQNTYMTINSKVMDLTQKTEDLELRKLKLIVQNSKIEALNESNLVKSKNIEQEVQRLQQLLEGKKLEYNNLRNQFEELDTKRITWLVANSKLENHHLEIINNAQKLKFKLENEIQLQESQVKQQQLEMAQIDELKIKSKEELNTQEMLIDKAVSEKVCMIFEIKKQEQILESLKERKQKESDLILEKQKEFETQSIKNQDLISQIAKKQDELKAEGVKYEEQVVFITKKVDELTNTLAALNLRVEKAKSIDVESRDIAKKALASKSTLLAEIHDLEVTKKILLEKNDVNLNEKKYDFKKVA